MKKTILLSAFFIGSLLTFKSADAQWRVHVNIGDAPYPQHGGYYDPYGHRHDEAFFAPSRWRGRHGYDRHWRDDDRGWRSRDDRYDDRRHADRRDDGDYRGDGRHGDRGRDEGRRDDRGDRDRDR